MARNVADRLYQRLGGAMQIYDLILIALALLALFVFCRWFIKRTILIVKLLGLKKQHGAAVKFLRFPYLPTSAISKKADIKVEILDTVYLIRLFSGGHGKKCVHFASPEFAVRFTSRISGRLAVSGRWMSHLVSVTDETFNTGVRVYNIPPINVPEEIKDGRRVENVLLFNPAPKLVSYVSKEKTTIKVAFTGDMVYDQRIFSASGFVAYADRRTRENDSPRYFG